MSNDELASNDEIKEYKEEGEEDRLASENLHSHVKPYLIDQVRCFNVIKVPLPSNHSPHHHHHHPHHGSHSPYHHLHSPLDAAHHYLRPPPPAHMNKWMGMDLEPSTKSISVGIPPWPLSQYPLLAEFPQFSHLSQWHSSAAAGMYQSPFKSLYPSSHHLNFSPSFSPHHQLTSPLSHSIFHSSPPPQPSSTSSFDPTLYHHHLLHPLSASLASSHLNHQINSQSSSPHSNNSNTTSTNSQPNSQNNQLLSQQHNQHSNQVRSDQLNQQPTSPLNVKKPLNAFMLFMKENRALVAAESARKESATINQILGKMWHDLPPDEQAKYYDKAKSARDAHRELYPGWTAKDNYANNTKKKKKKREKTAEGEGSLKKCRARFGLEHQTSWCKPCRRKKKCIKFREENEKND